MAEGPGFTVVMPSLVAPAITVMGEAYPDVIKNRDFITGVIAREEERFRQTLKTLDVTAPKAIVIAINDDYADGRDVSWLWDVDFAALAGGDVCRWLARSGPRLPARVTVPQTIA